MKPVLDEIARHADFDSTVEGIRRQIATSEVGFDLACGAAKQWLENAVASSANARRDLQSHADLGSAEAHYVTRPGIESALSQWWNSGPKAPAVLLGDEGRGKTWTALSWGLRQFSGTPAPMILAASAKDIRSNDPGEILSSLLSRSMPDVPRPQLAARLKRWLGGSPRILLLIDGLNEKWSTRWGDVVRSFEVEPWKSHVAILLTSRTAFWREDLLRLPGVSETPIVEIDVPAFSDAELIQFLGHHGLTKDKLPGGLLELVKIPRFAKLTISLMDRLRGTEDITVARLVLEDWRERLAQRGADLGVDDEGLIEFVADLGSEVLADKDFEISRAEIHKRLSEDSGLGLDDYRNAISELVEGHWLKPGERPHTYTVSQHLLPYALGLDLARSVEIMTDEAGIEDTIAKYEEQLRGADIGVAILRAAASVSFARQKSTPAARKALLRAWLRSQNFFGADFHEMWPLISRDPNLFLDVSEEHWRKSPVGYREGEVLAKGLANASKWPRVHELLVIRLARWSGAYGSDPIHWHHGDNVPPDEGRKKRTETGLAEWLSVQDGYHIPVTEHLRADADDYLPEAALAIISFLPRAPFIATIVTNAMTRAISHDDFDIALLQWLLRFNPHDHDAVEALILEEVSLLKKLSVPVASRAAVILLDSLATQKAMDIRDPDTNSHEHGTNSDNWPELSKGNAIVWRGSREFLAPDVWPERLVPLARLPYAELSGEDTKALEPIANGIGVDPNTLDFSLILQRATSTFARWTPSALGRATRQIFHSLPDRAWATAVRLAQQLPNVSLILSEHERDYLLKQGFERLATPPPEGAEQSRHFAQCCQSMIVAGLIDRSAAEQIAALKRLRANVLFRTQSGKNAYATGNKGHRGRLRFAIQGDE